ncbi:hypothetical protein [Burkholderia sp. Z1]|uniref:hypothetical protein n=1 Tax=Burkholderia sp. Z1 TaxID=2759039 RepID=UPI001866B07C|nr:hypothetical protein [Burkholderia sp. Z1]
MSKEAGSNAANCCTAVAPPGFTAHIERGDFASVPSFRERAARVAGPLIPVNTRVFNGFILHRMRSALRVSGRASGRGGAGLAMPAAHRRDTARRISARNPEQERWPWRSTNNNGGRCNSA